jgi:hypothetical protein
MQASHPLEGPLTNSRKFANLRVRDALEGHGERHLLDVIGDVAADHWWASCALWKGLKDEKDAGFGNDGWDNYLVTSKITPG